MNLKHALKGSVIGCCVLSAVSAMAQNITVDVNGQPLSDQGAQMVDGYVLVPLRDVSEGLGATVNWNQSSQTITLTKGQTNVSMIIGNETANVGGQTSTLDIAPRMINGVTMVPARFIGQTFGAIVNWNAATQTINFQMANADVQQTETETTTAMLRAQQQPSVPLKLQDDASGWLTAGKPVHFTLDATPGGTAALVLPGLSQEIPMQETTPGHYEATWQGEASNELLAVHEATAMAKLTLNGQTYYSGPQSLDIDTVPPTIQSVLPAEGTTISGFQPQIIANFVGSASGIDPSKTALSFNGQDVTQSCQITPQSVRYTLPNTLAPGNYTAHLTVCDKAGNRVTRKWNFSVMGGNASSNFTHTGDGTLAPGKDVVFTLQAVPGSQVVANIQYGPSVPLTETSPGVFSGTYTIRDHDHFGGNLVTATITPPNATPYAIQCQTPLGVSGNLSPQSMAPVIASPLASEHPTDPLIIAGSAPPASTVEIHVSYTTVLNSHTDIKGSLADVVVTADTGGNFQTKPLHILKSIEGMPASIQITAVTVLPDGTRSPETSLVVHPLK